MSAEPTPGKAGVAYRIIKDEDPNFNPSPSVKKGGSVGVYSIGKEVLNPVGMPSGPGGGRRKTRTFPAGILRKTQKIVPSRNPTQSPPTRKRSVRLLTNKRVDNVRKTAKLHASKKDIASIRKILIEKKIITSEKKNIPPHILRTLYADAIGAGLLNKETH